MRREYEFCLEIVDDYGDVAELIFAKTFGELVYECEQVAHYCTDLSDTWQACLALKGVKDDAIVACNWAYFDAETGQLPDVFTAEISSDFAGEPIPKRFRELRLPVLPTRTAAVKAASEERLVRHYEAAQNA